MLYTFQLLLTTCIVFASLFCGANLFIMFLDRDRFILAFITVFITIIITVFVLKNMELLVNSNNRVEPMSSVEDCGSQLEWLDKNVYYIMTFRFKEGERVDYQIVFRIDGTPTTEYRVSANTECNAIKKAVPIAIAYFEAQKQVEEEE